MAEIDADALLPSERMRSMAVDGDVTQIHRGDRRAEAGDTFRVDGVAFEVTDVTERTLGDMTDADARREGAADLAGYRRMLDRVHESFEWEDDSEVVRHRFERR